jgi:ribosome-associated protein
MEEGLQVTDEVLIPLDEIELRASRSSGPGGQHANVTASRIEATFEPGASSALSDEQKRRIVARCGRLLRASAQDTRSQARNRELALERLRSRIEAALVTPRARRATKPTAASRRRRLESKKRRSDVKRQRRRPDW